MRRTILGVAIALIASSAFAWGRSVTVPEWVKKAQAQTIPSYPPTTAGVVLLDERAITVDESGEILESRHVAIRILTSEGRELGTIGIPYDNDTKISSLHAWGVSAEGAFEIGDRDVAETSAVDGELYADYKVKVLRIPAADPGNVIAYEFERRERLQTLQDTWDFQRHIPVLTARYFVALPNGWSHEERWFNATGVAPETNGQISSWTMTGVAGVKEEPRRPAFRAVAGRMAINFIPRSSQGGAASHRSWDDVARWYATLTANRRAVTPAIQAKANELTAGKSTPFEKIAALASFAQRDIRYVAIEIGIGGFQPHFAQEIFGNRFGDCKDKATILGAMLKAIGIDSYYVLASSDRGVIDPKFASLAGWNHAILAIRLPAGTAAMPATMKSTKAGDILLFDPTSDSTPIGTAPWYLQDNDVLLVTDNGGELLHIPAHAADTNKMTISAKLSLDDSGTLQGDVREERGGWIAARWRATLRTENESQRKQTLEKRLSRSLPQYEVKDIAIENLDDLTKDLVVRYRLVAPSYAKHAGGLLLVRPRVFGTKVDGVLDLAGRTYAYESDGTSLEDDDFEIALPPGVAADELPAPVTASTRVASYRSETKVEGSVLRYRRQFRMDAVTVPRADLADLNSLFTKIVSDERASAVLKGR